MPGVFVELMKRVPSFQFLLHAYVRLLAVFMLFAGLNYWSAIIGVRLIDGMPFEDVGVQVQSTIIFFAILDLVTAIGLWLLSSWGTVMWLFRSLAQVVMYSVFPMVFGRSPTEVVFYISAIAVYLVLLYLAEREERA
ncbi:hypothetical protein PSE_3594 [Pseudovibrio sp. FO-BEG1]|uniref:Uncharacterized protein n=2 Tax=Pseudovibrio TaxID=258255 RepID=A0A1I7BP86_9HYPH|nr:MULTISPECIES: DUF6163 family protein [Pseudovibrio]AEV38098.1 hypothetical protein PSE_3594 [Pseudovibrio sp. FO-BEG1]EEA96401.1 conserved hypothetical protein [Pseudovibrio sp. JE062]QUS54270.1 hypothetical protein KGB56_12745 [Pseudovibrio brasiliensis]SFT88921.1 hypothetical protein SAMN05444141_104154 [Pseudovibrio denitrificans]